MITIRVTGQLAFIRDMGSPERGPYHMAEIAKKIEQARIAAERTGEMQYIVLESAPRVVA
jgi:hypothetical protein